jgi:hypothetical protein
MPPNAVPIADRLDIRLDDAAPPGHGATALAQLLLEHAHRRLGDQVNRRRQTSRQKQRKKRQR